MRISSTGEDFNGAFFDPEHFSEQLKPSTVVPSFHCDKCDKYFRYKSLFEQHNMTHTGEKPFTCEFCGMAFSRKYTLQSHVLSRHLKN